MKPELHIKNLYEEEDALLIYGLSRPNVCAILAAG